VSGRGRLMLGFALALGLALAFAGHAVWVALRVAEEPALVEDWMTPGLVMRTYGLSPEVLAGALGVDPGSAKGKTLAEIAEAQGVPVEAVVARVQTAVEAATGAASGAAGP
jgi:hypothetical protein